MEVYKEVVKIRSVLHRTPSTYMSHVVLQLPLSKGTSNVAQALIPHRGGVLSEMPAVACLVFQSALRVCRTMLWDVHCIWGTYPPGVMHDTCFIFYKMLQKKPDARWGGT